MILRNYFFTLAFSFFAIVLPFVGFSDCGVYKEGDYYVIRCSGILGEIPAETNIVYQIGDCEALKLQFLSLVDDITLDLSRSRSNISTSVSDLHELYRYGDDLPSDKSSEMYGYLETIENDLNVVDGDISHAIEVLSGPYVNASNEDVSLRASITNIECVTCSTNSSGGGSCSCDVDFSEILLKMNDAQRLRISVTNSLSVVASALKYFPTYAGALSDYNIMYDDLTTDVDNIYFPRQRNSVLSVLNSLHDNLSDSIGSINNYLYKISEIHLSGISNNVEKIYNVVSNQFSLFLVQSVLGDALSPTQNYGYYDFLTNHYIKVSYKDYSGMSDSQRGKTNWFARIETLLAAIVFSDSSTEYQVEDDSTSENVVSDANSAMRSLNAAPVSQMNSFRSSSQSVLDCIRIFNSSFSSVSAPDTVVLVRHSSNTRSGGDSSFSIEFQSSEIGPLVNAARCITTLCWTFGGLFFAYWLVHWCLMTSYKLVVFCYSVLSSIFGK